MNTVKTTVPSRLYTVYDAKGLKLKLKFSVLQSRTNKKPY